MPQNKRSIIAFRRLKVAQMYLSGSIQQEIADETGVTRQQIAQDLAILRKLWLQSALVDLDKAKSRELAKLDRLERECWTAWKESQKPQTKTYDKSRSGDEKQNYDEHGNEEISNVGDYRFLSGVYNCISKRCEILGLNAPFKLDATSKGRSLQPIQIIVDSPETKDSYNKLISIAKQEN